MEILIVEDEARLAESLAELLRSQRCRADWVDNGRDGVDYALTGRYDAIILDVMLPKLDGFQAAKRIRQGGCSTPILMLTARDEVADKVQGLDCGADDYMTKPFAPEELLARLRALTRRQGDVVADTLEYSGLVLNLSTHCLGYGGREVRLGYKEFEVLRLLLARPNLILPKEELLVKVWGTESDAEDNNVEAYISFLRKKLHFLGAKVTIRSARKVGYYLEVEET